MVADDHVANSRVMNDCAWPEISLSGSYRDFKDDPWGFQEKHAAFLSRFTSENGRKPRILHIGNIANNAFKNAHILRKHGVDCDVICYDYYHVMGCPEWELAKFDASELNFDAPDWSKVDLGGYQRPRWFAQGRIMTCVDYLLSLRENSSAQEELWQLMARQRDSGGQECPGSSPWSPYDAGLVQAQSERLAALFEATFPDRADRPSAEAITLAYGAYLNETQRFRRLFAHYDLIIGYAMDGLLPLIASKVPYASFEHGTIRTLPFDTSLTGQLCALSYACASDVLISNCDNIVASRRLRLRSLRFLPHAMLEDFRHDVVAADLRATLLAQHDADFVIFHPSRQHWSVREDVNWEKGNDRLIRAFARLLAGERPKALLIMVAWGQMVEESRQLVADLGASDRVIWLKPKSMLEVGQYVAAADCLADQFVIGAWGAIMPHGMMLGIPTMLHLNESLHEWCFPEMPPVRKAQTENEILAALKQLTKLSNGKKPEQHGTTWYDRFHSESVVAGRLVDSMMACLRRPVGEELFSAQRELHAEIIAARRAAQAARFLAAENSAEFARIGIIASSIENRSIIRKLKVVRSKLASLSVKLKYNEKIFVRGAFYALFWPYLFLRWAGRGIGGLLRK